MGHQRQPLPIADDGEIDWVATLGGKPLGRQVAHDDAHVGQFLQFETDRLHDVLLPERALVLRDQVDEDVRLVHELALLAGDGRQHPFNVLAGGEDGLAVAQQAIDLVDAGADRQDDVGNESTLVLARR